MIPRDDATAAQVRAAQPDLSTWLAANAGSGKTRVLTDRVARLLLEKVEPQHILCLTYTKAAASEMQNRLFRRLGEWAMLDDVNLLKSLNELGVEGKIDRDRLRQARTLFARAIETPGGLKIQTIHSFCAALLRRFPLEARVSPQFVEIEDRAAELLRAEVVDNMADGPDAHLVQALAQYYTGEDFTQLTKAVVQHKDRFQYPMDLAGALNLFDQPPDISEASILASVFLGEEQDLIDQIIPPMRAKGGNDEKAALRLAVLQDQNLDALPLLEAVFLTGPNAKLPYSAKIGNFPTKATQQQLGALMPVLEAFMLRVESARAARIGLNAARKALALNGFARRFITFYEEQKMLRGWLDFDDLINRARALLNDEKVAAWVLFRLDGGIDHILVDEAQDTSPAQWDVIRKLADEFTSGQGARADERRTIFVVGDKKQSIYSFQGADPREFDRMRAEFRKRMDAAGQRLQDETLLYSFRSSAAILRTVDQAFSEHGDAGFAAAEEHIPFKSALPGRVDLWPVIPKTEEAEEDRAWYDPVDRKGAQHHTVILASQVAEQIKKMIDRGETIPVDEEKPGSFARRALRAGDFLILVQRRSELFAEIIRACKNAGLDIAGADRLKVGGELAVRDLAALLSFLAMPEDSLSLATALKSPIFNWSEQDLFDLAHKRTEDHLWQALRHHADDYPATLEILRDLRRNVDFLRPYDLIERILTRHRGRQNLLARLGAEAEDGINALLSQALAYERNAIPSLTGFLIWMETDNLEIKRQIDSAFDQIRVMTVHGAKGLEAPVVILPETGRRDIRIRDEILMIDGKATWKTPADEMPVAMQNTVAALREAEERERLRLLYVALTRAEKWLIVAACGELPRSANSWYQITERALEAAGAVTEEFQGLTIKRLSHKDWTDLPLKDGERKTSETVEPEPFYNEPAPRPAATLETVSPSDLGGAKALPGEKGRSDEAAKAYGTLVHRFLEHMAAAYPEDRNALVQRLHSPDCTPEDHNEARAEAMKILESDALRFLFGPETLSEVAITAPFGEKRLHGFIDRLIFSNDEIMAVDFKTNRMVPDRPEACPDGILRQMGAYLDGLRQIYPDHTISVAILWTHTAQLMVLPHDIVREAIESTPYLDAGDRAS